MESRPMGPTDDSREDVPSAARKAGGGRASSTLVIYGCGGHGRSAAGLAERAGYVNIVFVDDAAAGGERIMDYPVLRSVGEHLIDEDCLVAFGDSEKRLRHVRALADAGRRLVSVTAASAVVSRYAVVEQACFIGEFAYVGPLAEIGVATIVNTGAIVEHDCVIGSGCHVSVGVKMAGGCRLGDRVTIWPGATLRRGVSIVADVYVGAGAVVCGNLDTPGTYVGVPARLRKTGAGP
jgi:sugar O-acyltransferase (sialic acid O-acetyltransferase NeuD family)